MIRLSPYYCAIEDFKGKKVLFMEDALSKRYIRQIEAASTESGIAGRFSSRLPGFMNRLINSKALKNRILRSESKRLEKEEVRAARLYDAVIYVNEIEANEMNQKTGRKNSFTVTQGADCDYYSAPIEVKKMPNTLSYVGNMGVAANADAVRMIMDKIMPLIPSKPVIHFIGNAPENLRDEFKDNPLCVFEGRVDDIRLSVRATEIVLSPIAYGTGVKTKVIEGMAMSMPVVTNYLGIDGLSVEVGRDLLMSDDFNEIAAMVEELLHDPQRREELGKHGYDYAMAHHQWKDIYKVFGQMGL
jgi:glycosyltransferase involved in cell wall biosynthesis